MILGEPNLQSVLDLIEADGCPLSGKQPGAIQFNGPDGIILECEHNLGAKAWIDSYHNHNEAGGS